MGTLVRVMVLAGVAAATLASGTTSAAGQWAEDGALVCGARGSQGFADITSDGAGGAVVVWRDTRDGDSNIYAQRVNARGWLMWGQLGVRVCSAVGDQGHPSVVTDGAGGALVVWTDARHGDDDLYAQRLNRSGTAMWDEDGNPVALAPGHLFPSSVIPDGVGGAIVTWSERHGIDEWIRAQKIDSSGSLVWMVEGAVLCASTGERGSASACSDGSGGAIVAWTDQRSGYDDAYDIYAQRVSASGAILWDEDGVPVCTAEYDQRGAVIVPDDSGGGIIVWGDYRNGQLDVYAQRLGPGGGPAWTAGGIPICTHPFHQFYGPPVPDEEGGVIVVWHDHRSGPSDVFGQRFTASGDILWPEEGAPLSTAPGSQWNVLTAPDGQGGAVVAWHHLPAPGPEGDIYAQRVHASGAPMWGQNGVALCMTPGRSYGHAITGDGSGGAIVAWTDERAGVDEPDLYVQRVSASGTPSDEGESNAPGVLIPSSPNPFASATRIQFLVRETGPGSLRIYDVSGRLVKTLADGVLGAGGHERIWDGRDGGGRKVASGVYFYRLETDSKALSRKLVLLK